MCCKKNTIIFIVVLEIISNLFLLAICGRIKRVVGAVDVECGTQPRALSLRNSTSLQHVCGATLLSPHFALTAAHCVPHCEDQYILQLNNYCVDDGLLPRAKVLEITRHGSYNTATRAHDVAMLRVALPVDDLTWLSDTLLPTSFFGISGECTIYGYGYKDLNTMETSEKLLAGTLKIVSLDECTMALGPNVAPGPDDGMMCAVGDGIDACQGDSGSPLICSGGTIEAISSYGMSCAVPGLPGVYVSVGAHLPWIREILKSHE